MEVLVGRSRNVGKVDGKAIEFWQFLELPTATSVSSLEVKK